MTQRPDKLSIFDLDNSLAEKSENYIRPAYFNYLYSVVNTLQPMSFEAFMVHMNEYNARGMGTFGWARHLGKSDEWVHEHHHLMSPLLAEAAMSNLQPNPQVHRRLAALKDAGHKLAIYTHGHANYALPVVQHLGLSPYFVPEDIYDITTNNRRLKTCETSYRFIVAEQQQRLGRPFRLYNMVEDNAHNLHAAKKAGFTTILIGGDEYPPEEGQLIDAHVSGLVESLDYLAAQH